MGEVARAGAAPRTAQVEDGRLAQLRRRLPLWLAVGVGVALAVGVLGDAPKVGTALAGFDWALLPAILALTLLNYGIRFVKWEVYLRLIGAPHVPRGESALIFIAGLSMTMTPGKVGEWLKSYLLRERWRVPMAASAPIILAERLTDGVAMLLLALGGLLAYGVGRELIVLIALGALVFVVLTQLPAVRDGLLRLAERVPFARGRVHHLQEFLESSRRLFSPGALGMAVGMGLVSWGGECVAFYLVLVGLGVAPGAELLLQSAFILATSSLIGSVSMLPGGLAVAEGSIAGMLLLLGVTAQPAVAAAATLLIRFCTLWFGIGVGVVALILIGRRPLP
jgi:uncharacterized protein (TIRG00374 family)